MSKDKSNEPGTLVFTIMGIEPQDARVISDILADICTLDIEQIKELGVLAGGLKSGEMEHYLQDVVLAVAKRLSRFDAENAPEKTCNFEVKKLH